jgi:hypothetical protein
MKIIGITGKKRSGKDTLANIIIKNSNDTYEKVSFADPMRDIMREVCNPSRRLGYLVADWSGFNYEMEKERECLVVDFSKSFFGPTLIKALSYNTGDVVGNGIKFIEFVEQFEGRLFSPREFLQKLGTEFARETLGEDVWVDMLMSSLDEDKNYIIPDVRFDNEAKAIDGMIIETVREGQGADQGDSHKSEKGIDSDLIDIVLLAKDINDLEEKWIKLIDHDYECVGCEICSGGDENLQHDVLQR